jgi:hypothetical protein
MRMVWPSLAMMGWVAGKLLPLSVRPMPESLRMIVYSASLFGSLLLSFGSMIKAPKRPFVT